jgi:hypothetical protein
MNPHLYEQTDFASPDETLSEWRHRLHPLPAKGHIAGFVVFGIGGAAMFLLGLAVFGSLAAFG